MRQRHGTVTPSVVRSTARALLHRALPWQGYGRRVGVRDLLDLLLLAGCLASSLSAVVKRFRFGFSHETARRAVHANLTDLDTLADGLVDALYCFGTRLLRRRDWVVAFDLHFCPFYGDRSTAGIVGGQKKHGTQYFFGYATAVLVRHGHRYTVGLVALTGSQRPHAVVAALLAQLDARGMRLRGVVLDSGFDSGDVLLLLQGRGLAYTIPLRRKGKGSNRRNDCFALAVGTVTTVQWVTDLTRRTVTTEAVVRRRPGEKAVKVYAFAGWHAGRAVSAARRVSLAKRWYRKRFGIETSYRQLNAAKAATTSKDGRYRLLLVGLALLLRQAWVWLTWQVARAWGLRPSARVAALPLARLLDWLAEQIKKSHPEKRSIDLGRPLPGLDFAC